MGDKTIDFVEKVATFTLQWSKRGNKEYIVKGEQATYAGRVCIVQMFGTLVTQLQKEGMSS